MVVLLIMDKHKRKTLNINFQNLVTTSLEVNFNLNIYQHQNKIMVYIKIMKKIE